MFRVVPDQLRISEGWVRCGQCDEVFDANAHLQSIEESALVAPAAEQQVEPQPIEVEESPVAVVALSADSEAAPTSGYDWGAVVSEPPAADFTAHLEYEEDPLEPQADPLYGSQFEVSLPAPELDYQPEADPFLAQSPVDLPGAAKAEDHLAPKMHAEELGDLQGDSAPFADSRPKAAAVEPEKPLSFMPRKAEPSRFARILHGPILWATCLLLAFLLAGQAAMAERNRLAAMYPGVQPMLQTMCDALGCKVSAPRQIDAIAIESSTFTSVRTGVYSLGVTLKSTGVLALEAPALELTLTDTQDKPLLRRVLLANEYAGKQNVLVAGGELSANVPLRVQMRDASESIAGYKLLAFYP